MKANEHEVLDPINIDFDMGDQGYDYEKDLEGSPIDMKQVLVKI